ncbi:Golgi-associated plant pathogenesis-related protein 1-like [Mytilus trossulus]|uniref:Golgi-associated plant pathogenesis-related protein 1-like n=1 Tax=Mytilus trossulus TaxID=6551 RepID=UPI00300643AD
MSCFGCSPQYPSVKQFTTEGLILHNNIRRKHNVPSLKFSKDLVQHAQEWAEYLVKTNQDTPEVQHLRRKNIGQNVTVKDSYDNYAVDYSAEDIIKEWYSGVDIYQPYFGREPPPLEIIKGYGHFSQMIWKESKEMGMGKAIGNDRTVIVASYRPAGNGLAKFTDNVKEPNDKVLIFKYFKM